MEENRVSAREARIDLDFAILHGDRYRIEVAEKRLEQALAEAEKRRRTRKIEQKSDSPRFFRW